jgi:hypothetical protein
VAVSGDRVRVEEELPRLLPSVRRLAAQVGDPGEPGELRLVAEEAPPEATERLRLELRDLRSLEHPAFPQVLSEGEWEGRLMVAVTPTPGEPWDALAGDPDLPDASRARLVRSLVDAWGHAAERGVALDPAGLRVARGRTRVRWAHLRGEGEPPDQVAALLEVARGMAPEGAGDQDLAGLLAREATSFADLGEVAATLGVTPALEVSQTISVPARRSRRRAAAAVGNGVLALALLGAGLFLMPRRRHRKPPPPAPPPPRSSMVPLHHPAVRDPYLHLLLKVDAVDPRGFPTLLGLLRRLSVGERLPELVRDPERVEAMGRTFRDDPVRACRQLEAWLEELREAVME